MVNAALQGVLLGTGRSGVSFPSVVREENYQEREKVFPEAFYRAHLPHRLTVCQRIMHG